MLINKKGNELLNANLSFFSRQINDNAVEIEKGIIIQPSGIPLLLEHASTKKQNSEDNLYLNFISDPLNGSVTGCSVIKKSEFKFQDRSFHYPVLIRKNKKNEGINSDIAHYQPSYGNVNVQIVEELVDNPTRFIVKISDFDGFYDGGRRKLYVENYVSVGGGVKILGAVRNVNSDYEDKLQLRSTYEQSKAEYNSSSYFIPLALIDTDRKDFTILY